MDNLAIDDIFRIKFKDVNIEPGYTYYPPNTKSNPSRIDYLLVSKKLIIDMLQSDISSTLQFSKVSIQDKSNTDSDHNSINWTITAQPRAKLNEFELISRCKFKPSILLNSNVTQDIYLKIMHILDPYYYPDFNIDLVEQIQSLDRACDYTPFKGSPNQLDVFEKIINAIKTCQYFYEKDVATYRNFKINGLKKEINALHKVHIPSQKIKKNCTY